MSLRDELLAIGCEIDALINNTLIVTAATGSEVHAKMLRMLDLHPDIVHPTIIVPSHVVFQIETGQLRQLALYDPAMDAAHIIARNAMAVTLQTFREAPVRFDLQHGENWRRNGKRRGPKMRTKK